MSKVIETKRLILRPISMKDDADMFEYARIEGLGYMAGWSTHQSIDETRQIIEKMIQKYHGHEHLCNWAIIWKENNKMIGTIELHSNSEQHKKAELGYVVAKDYWGNGIAKEAGRAIVLYGFEKMNYHRIAVEHFDFNLQSKRVIEKIGFKYEGRLRRSRTLLDGKVVDQLVYSIVDNEIIELQKIWQEEAQ